MTVLQSGTVRTGDCIVLWDGITRPEAVPATADKPASQKFTLKLAFPPDAPTYGELYGESEKFTNTKYPGGRPRGFEGAFRPAEVPELPGWIAVNAATFGQVPEIFDMQGRSLSPAEYGRMFYAGAKVQALLTPRVYDANGNRGAGFWLGGILIVDATAPKLSVASGLSAGEMRNAFGLPASPLAGSAPAAGIPPVPGVAAPAIPPLPGAAAVAPPMPPASGSFPPPPVPGGSASGATTSPSSPPPVAVAPNYGMLQPPAPPVAPTPPAPAAPVRTMTPAAMAAGFTFEALAAAGWSEAQMVQAGYLVPA